MNVLTIVMIVKKVIKKIERSYYNIIAEDHVTSIANIISKLGETIVGIPIQRLKGRILSLSFLPKFSINM